VGWGWWERDSYATAGNPLAPPQPMRTMLKVKVAITKLGEQTLVSFLTVLQSYTEDSDGDNCYPRNPKGVAFAYLPTLSLACGTFGARYSFSNISGLRLMLVVAWLSWGLESVSMLSWIMGSVVAVAILNIGEVWLIVLRQTCRRRRAASCHYIYQQPAHSLDFHPQDIPAYQDPVSPYALVHVRPSRQTQHIIR
jgi:hypothetical protein